MSVDAQSCMASNKNVYVRLFEQLLQSSLTFNYNTIEIKIKNYTNNNEIINVN